jgi:hypothetical protein
MNKTTQERIEEIKKNGYTLNFETVFNHAFENYKKIALYGGLIIFVFFILFSIFAIGVLMAIFGGAVVLDFLKPENLKPEDLSLNFLLIVSAISVIVTALLSPLTAGLIKMAYCAERDEEFQVATMFQYYKAPYFKELFVATFLISVLTSVLSSVINYAQIPFINAIVSITVTLFTLFMIPLIIFGNLKALEAIQTSFMIVSKQPLVLLGLLVVGIIATMVGFIGCCIGIVFTIPFIYSLYYAMYSEVVGFDPETDLENRM